MIPRHCLLHSAVSFALTFWLPAAAFCADETLSVSDAPDAHVEYVYDIRISDDGNSVLTAAGDNTAAIWNADTLTKRYVLQHDAAVYSAAWNVRNSTVITGTGDGDVLIWNAQTGQLQHRLSVHQDAIYSVDVSPDGRLFAAAGGSTDGGDTGIRIFSTQDNQVQHVWSGHERQVYGVIWSPNGKQLASSSSDKTIRLWNVADGKSEELTGHTSDVYRCVFSPDGLQLISASQDKSVRIWDLKTRTCTATLPASKDPVYGVVLANKQLWSVGGDGQLRAWQRMQPNSPLISQRVLRGSLYAIANDLKRNRFIVAGEDGRMFQVDHPAENTPTASTEKDE